MEYLFDSGSYTALECFARADSEHSVGRISVHRRNGGISDERVMSYGMAGGMRFVLEPVTEYVFSVSGAVVGEMYLSGCPDLLRRGVCYLVIEEGQKRLAYPELKSWYDVPEREQFHFTPFLNWMNDPNGLICMDGRYHMFYQKNPFDQIWGNMYWGHAVSTDLVHWVHLPVALEPQGEVLADPNRLGGAFSGSACLDHGRMRIFFTRDLEYRDHSRRMLQSQVTAVSDCGIHFEEEEEAIPAFSVEGAGENFRDPKVTQIDGEWYLVLGSQIHGKAAVLLFESVDLKKWRYLCPLIVEEDPEIEAFECPDFFKLDGKYVVTGAWMSYEDEYGRFNPVRYYIGDFQNGQFVTETAGFCDFGCDYYASQSFAACDRRIQIGWIPDWRGLQKPYRNGCRGSASVPRELHIVNGRFIQKPVSEIYSLLDGEPVYEKAGNASRCGIPGNTYYADITFAGETDFEICFACSVGNDYRLKRTGETLEVLGENRGVRYVEKSEHVRHVELFVDRRVVEICINDGERIGTKLILTNSRTGIFEASFAQPENAACVRVFRMKSIWQEEGGSL